MTIHEPLTESPASPTKPGTPASGGGLTIRGLHKILGGRTIIDNLDLSVKEGELVSLLGPPAAARQRRCA
ncbi:ABC transporter protein [Arthrobacter sp. Hiyo8]|nr:ABC transporter protein [Arthrobacter sp. Hiyo8]